MKPRDVSVSVIEQNGEVKVWNASFTIKGILPGSFTDNEKLRRHVEKRIENALKELDF